MKRYFRNLLKSSESNLARFKTVQNNDLLLNDKKVFFANFILLLFCLTQNRIRLKKNYVV